MSGSQQPWWQSLPVAPGQAQSAAPPPAAPGAGGDDGISTVTVRAPRPDSWWKSLPLAEGQSETPQQPAPPPKGALPDWAVYDSGQAPAKQAAPAQADRSTLSGIAGAIPSGLYAGVAAVPNLPTYALNAASNVLRGFGAEDFGQLTPPINVNPTNYQPHGAAERATYAGAEAVGSLPGMALGGELAMPFTAAGSAPRAIAQGFAVPMGAPSIAKAGEAVASRLPTAIQAPVRGAANMASALPVGAVPQAVGIGGMVGQGASEMVPPQYAPLVNAAGNLVGAGGVAGLQAGLGGFSRAFGNRLGAMGVGPKTDIGGVRVTPQQADIAAQRVAGALGPEGYDLLQSEQPNTVPGYEPTLAQVAPTSGAVQLEKSFRTARGAPFIARAEQQNAAQVGAVTGMGGQGNPGSVGQFFTTQLDALRGQGDVATTQAAQGVRGQAQALGGQGTPEGYGATAAQAVDRVQAPLVARAQQGVADAQAARNQAVAAMPGGKLSATPEAGPVNAQYGAQARGQLMVNRQAAADRENALWKAVNPDGTAGGPAAPIRDRVAAIYSDLSPDAKPPTGEEAAILSRITGWGDTARLTDIQALRSRVGDAIDTEVNAAGRTQTDVSRRLQGVKGAIDGGLQDMIDQRAAQEAADVAAGRLAPEQTIIGRLERGTDNGGALGSGRPSPGFGNRPGVGQESAGAETGAPRGGALGTTTSRSGPVVAGQPSGIRTPGAAGAGGTVGTGAGRYGTLSGTRGLASGATAQGVGRKPESIVDFLISRGGVQDQGGDLKAIGADTVHHQAGGRLVNPRGVYPDYAREAAEEAGFLRPGSSTNDLYDAIAEHVSGRPVYRISEQAEGDAHANMQQEAARSDAARDRAAQDVLTAEYDAGVRLTPEEVDHATRLTMQGVHPHEALDLAVRQREDAGLQQNAQMNAFGQPGIPLAQQPSIPKLGGGRPVRPFTADELDAMRAARDASAQRARTFDERRVGEALAPGEYRTAAEVPDSITRARGGFHLADEQLMSKFWNKGPTQASDAQDFVRAGGDPALLKDYAADDLRSRAVGLDGSFDVKEFAKWRRDHADALLAFPEMRSAFDGAANAQETLAARQGELAAVRESHPLRGVGFQSQIMGRYWKAGDEGADRVRQYVADTGRDPAAARALDDYAVYKLREAGAVQPDGAIDPKKLDRYMADHAQALAERPALANKLKSVQSAQSELDRVTAEHARALQDYQTKNVAAFLGDDPMQAIRTVFETRDSAGAMRDVLGKVKGNDDAVAGLKRLAADYILKKLSSLTPEGTSTRDYLNARSFRQWVDSHKGAVRQLYGGQGLQMLDAIAANLRRQAPRTAATPGSDTVPKAMGLVENGLAPAHEKSGAGVALALIAEHAGEHVGAGLGGPAAIAALVGKHLWSAMRQTGAKRVADLTTEVLLHPTTVGRELLAARLQPNGSVGPMAGRRIAAALQGSMVADLAKQMQPTHAGLQ